MHRGLPRVNSALGALQPRPGEEPQGLHGCGSIQQRAHDMVVALAVEGRTQRPQDPRGSQQQGGARDVQPPPARARKQEGSDGPQPQALLPRRPRQMSGGGGVGSPRGRSRAEGLRALAGTLPAGGSRGAQPQPSLHLWRRELEEAAAAEQWRPWHAARPYGGARTCTQAYLSRLDHCRRISPGCLRPWAEAGTPCRPPSPRPAAVPRLGPWRGHGSSRARGGATPRAAARPAAARQLGPLRKVAGLEGPGPGTRSRSLARRPELEVSIRSRSQIGCEVLVDKCTPAA